MENNHSSNKNLILVGNLLAFSAALCWGFNEPANKLLIPTWMSASAVALARIFGATILVWIASLFVKNEKIQRGDWKILVFAALFMLGFVYVFSMAFNTASPIDVAIILTFQPMLVVLIHVIFKHEKINGLEMLGMLIAFGGALMVILSGGQLSSGKFIGNVYAMICAVSYAAYLVIIEGPSQKYHAVNLMRWVFLFTAILALPLVFTVHDEHIFHAVSANPWLVLGFIILFPTVYCYIVTPPAIRMIGSELLSVYQYLVPVVATVASLLLKLDSFHWYQPVSFLIIVAGVLLANYATKKRKAALQHKP